MYVWVLSFTWINSVISGIFRSANINCDWISNINAAVGFAKKGEKILTEITSDNFCSFLVCNRNNQILNLFL